MTIELVQKLQEANNNYRNGQASISDEQYDQMIADLKAQDANHPFLNTVEPEGEFGEGKIRHSRPMLSTSKAYTDDELSSWAQRVDLAALEAGAGGAIVLKLTAKLDGMAGRYESAKLASRGNGLTGNDLTHMIEKGLAMSGSGDGEIVISQSYFDENLSDAFMHPRNVVTGIVGADNISEAGLKVLQDSALHFAAYESLHFELATTQDIVERLPVLREKILAACPYPTDGIIITVEDNDVRSVLGSTGHHHNWMLAAKTVSEIAETKVEGITWQVGRTGRLTPVVNITPVEVSGAKISNVTAHHAGNVIAQRIGKGAKISLTRSGEVIPKIIEVISPAVEVEIPTQCSCCGEDVEMQKDFLVCNNLKCHDRATARLNHFFATIGTIDLFGPKACSMIVETGLTEVSEIFKQTENQFMAMGFGAGQAKGLVSELKAAKTRAVDDFLVLGAFGIPNLGRGDSKKLLRQFKLAEMASVTSEQIVAINGFGEVTSQSIGRELPVIEDQLKFLCEYLENIIATASAASSIQSPITGKNIVFTGSMESGPRPEMIKKAESLGAISQSSVNKKTDILVTGGKVGAAKIEKAEKLGTKVIKEADYIALIAGL